MQATQQLVDFPLPENPSGKRHDAGPSARQQRASQSVIGKTVTGIISKPVSGGRESLLMLQFSDGSCFEFVSPAAQRALSRRSGRTSAADTAADNSLQQLSFFPHDGKPAASSTPVF
ncbi:MAG: hypothetical protein AAGB27_14100 [Pseudomonadota bacterium]